MLGVKELSRARQDMGLKGKAKFGAERSGYCPLLNCSLPSQSEGWPSLVFSFGTPPSPGSSPPPPLLLLHLFSRGGWHPPSQAV